MASTQKKPVSRKQTGVSTQKTAVKKPAAAPAPVQPAGTAKKPVRPGVKAQQAVAQPAAAPRTEKPVKAKKPKLVRDSFTIPKAEYVVLDELKQRATGLAHPIKKSELLRAGIKALAAMSDTGFLAALEQVPAIKTGRPAA
ncbi:MAG: hypothetical protein C0428_12810 [Polaromonas sp.]|nr:hypothetical protein [Polaromonas sp.]